MNYFPEYVQLCLSEIPGEISVVIPLAGCLHHCPNCHTPIYQDKNGGELLIEDDYRGYLQKYKGKASCVLLFNGEYDPTMLAELSWMAKDYGFKTALYSGFDLDELPKGLAECFEYLKTGSYNEKLGGINVKGTNQRLWKRVNGELVDITAEMQRG